MRVTPIPRYRTVESVLNVRVKEDRPWGAEQNSDNTAVQVLEFRSPVVVPPVQNSYSEAFIGRRQSSIQKQDSTRIPLSQLRWSFGEHAEFGIQNSGHANLGTDSALEIRRRDR